MGGRSLSFRPGFVPKTIGGFLDEVSTIVDTPEKTSKLYSFMIRLEEEMKKIDAFKRELPLCTLLLNDAILALKESLQCVSAKARPLLLESIQVKRETDENDIYSDKKNWMKSVQLGNCGDSLKYDTKPENKENENESGLSATDMFPSSTRWSGGKGFMAIKASSLEEWPNQGLSLLRKDIKDRKEKSSSGGLKSRCSENDESSSKNGRRRQQLGPKPRRCWSSELHRLFVNSLQKLGGAQVASPKQIRDLMQVEGLTNDEVKSHLQKYRLHTRKLPGKNQSLDISRSSWQTQVENGESSNVSRSQSGSPQGPLQLASTAKTSIEDDEDDTKSDSFSWKNNR